MKSQIILICLFFTAITSVFTQTIDKKYYDAMQWRMIGPHRGGRTVGAVGVPKQPNVFYIGVNNGGVWKTTDFGRTWNPIFDEAFYWGMIKLEASRTVSETCPSGALEVVTK